MEKLRIKRVPYLDRFELHMDDNTKQAQKRPIYRMRTLEVNENGNIVREVST